MTRNDLKEIYKGAGITRQKFKTSLGPPNPDIDKLLI